ncbi:MAG: protein kinase [Myxococcota bacterium]
MDVELYRRAMGVFLEAVEEPVDARPAFVRRACAGDAELHDLVVRMLVNDGVTTAAPAERREDRVHHPLNTGDSVGAYEVRHRLGHGGAAEVWAVRHRVLGTLHALKVLTHTERAMAERLRREGRAQARLLHRHILPIRDIVESNGTPALLMPLVDGPSLADLLYAHALEPSDALALFVPVLRGVAHAHEHGLAHRDLKPHNVLLSLADHRVTPLVVDFGLVKDLQSPGELTRTGSTMGTPAYMAPEQLQSASTAGAPADVFALGVMLVELLTGQRPYEGRTLEAIAAAWEGPPEIAGVPAELRRLVAAMVDIAPERRPPHAAAVLERLDVEEGTDRLLEGQRLFGWAIALRNPVLQDLVRHTTTPSGEPVHTLPRSRDRFLGRDDELAELARRLQHDPPPDVLTVLGPGGVGKTRLCLEVARATLGQWPGGAWWVDAASARDEAGLVAAAANGLQIELGADPRDAIGHAIANRGRCLVVLDNLEQVVGVLPTTLGRWSAQAPQAVFLCTSRAPLGLPGERMVLGGLSDDDARALFVQRARALQPSFSVTPDDDAPLRRLNSMLDGLPLAIELAAAQSRLLSPEQLVARLESRPDGLRSRSTELPERQRTLAATLAWSWELLDDAQQRVLAQLSVFEGEFTVDEAAAVVSLPGLPGADPWLDDVLVDLIDRSLLHSPRPGRLRLLVSTRAFAASRLTDVAAVHLRHARYYGRPAGPARFETLRRDPANLVAAARWAASAGETALAAESAVLAARAIRDVAPASQARDLLTAALALPGLEAVHRVELLEGRA